MQNSTNLNYHHWLFWFVEVNISGIHLVINAANEFKNTTKIVAQKKITEIYALAIVHHSLLVLVSDSSNSSSLGVVSWYSFARFTLFLGGVHEAPCLPECCFWYACTVLLLACFNKKTIVIALLNAVNYVSWFPTQHDVAIGYPLFDRESLSSLPWLVQSMWIQAGGTFHTFNHVVMHPMSYYSQHLIYRYQSIVVEHVSNIKCTNICKYNFHVH